MEDNKRIERRDGICRKNDGSFTPLGPTDVPLKEFIDSGFFLPATIFISKDATPPKVFTEEQVAELKTKADKWDALRKDVGKFYEGDAVNGDLMDIGEMTAIRLGFL